MTEQDDVVLSAAERAALAIERERPSFDGAAAARMLRRLQLAVGPGAPPGGGQAPPAPPAPPGGSPGGAAALGGAATASLAKLAAVFALGLAVGGAGVGVVLQRPAPPRAAEAPPAEATAPSAVTTELDASPDLTASLGDASAPLWRVSDLPSRPEASRAAVAPSERSAPDPTALVAESQIIDGVRTALGRGDAAAALALLDQHGARFPRGALAEEAGALRVRALRSAGRAAEADRAAREFLVRYPKSLFRPMVSP